MESNIANKDKNELTNRIGIKDIFFIDDFIGIYFQNGQKILINKTNQKHYDISEYDAIGKIFFMNGKPYAEALKNYVNCFVDLDEMKVIYEDSNCYRIFKHDERTIEILTHKAAHILYNIESKKNIFSIDGYEFEKSLNDNLYVFRNKESAESVYDEKRIIVDCEGNIILSDIRGFVYYQDDHLIINRKNSVSIIDKNMQIKTFEKGGDIIADPEYNNGNIIIIEKNKIKIMTADLTIKKEITVDGLIKVIDKEILGDIIKLLVPFKQNGKDIGTHIYLNIKTGKQMSHLRIEGHPYWIPTTFIGTDSLEEGLKEYHFYNKDGKKTISISAFNYDCVDSKKENIFVIQSQKDNHPQTYLLNVGSGITKEINYNHVNYHHTYNYGYGANFITGQMDFIDENFNIIAPSINYKDFELRLGDGGFGYFISNNYLCILKHFTDGYARSQTRTILINPQGEVILNSVKHRCYMVKEFIQIVHNNESEFLNTLTGERGSLSIVAPVNSEGKIDFNALKNAIFAVDKQENVLKSSYDDELTRLLTPPTNKND
ncbi:MAG: hypothetical protein IJO33_02255 [Bacilli bacterium]|nr:hypothetical protein [Bacilli bacterium]